MHERMVPCQQPIKSPIMGGRLGVCFYEDEEIEVVEQIEEKNLTVLYVEEYTSTSSVDSIVEQTGVTIKILYTMELPPKDSEDTYLTLMNKNLNSLVEGMGC